MNDRQSAARGGRTYQIQVMLDEPGDIAAVEAAAVLLGAGPVTVDSTGPRPIVQLLLAAPNDTAALEAAAAAALAAGRQSAWRSPPPECRRPAHAG